MIDTPENPRLSLPPALQGKLAGFEQRLCRTETAVAALVGVAGVLLTYGLLLGSDRLWDTPAWARAILTAGGGAAAAACAAWWFRRWVWRRRDARALARLVQQRFGRLGDRLLGVVELTQAQALPGHMSEALCRAAIRQVAQDVAPLDFREAVNSRRARRWTLTVGALALILATPVLLAPEAGLNALRRWLRPLAPVERYTFARVQDLPAELAVPHGEPFELACRVAPDSRWRPARGVCRIGRQPPVEARVRGGLAVFRLPGQTGEGVAAVRVGDAKRDVRVKPLHRPELIGMTQRVRLPEYLQQPERTNRIEGGSVRAVEGARLRLIGTVSRTLGHIAADSNAVPVEATGPDFATAWFPAGAPSNCVFRWSDCFGIAGSTPCRIRTETVPDAAPAVECRGLSPVMAILQDETLRFSVAGADDFGLRGLQLSLTVTTGAARRGTSRQRTLREGAPTAAALEAEAEFSPLVDHVPEESQVTLRALATDYLPGREPAQSEEYRILVLSRAQHARLLAEQMDRLLSGLDELARAEEDLLGRNRELMAQPEESLRADKAGERVKASQGAERRQADRMAELMREMQNLSAEAMRNKDVDAGLLQRWADTLKQGAALSTGEWARAQQALAGAAGQPSERGKQLKAAASEEESIVKALREMSSGVNSSVEDMMAASLANRLRQVGRTEGETAQALMEAAPGSVGMAAAELSPPERERLESLAGRHDGARGDTAIIMEDLAGFFRRTRKPAYGAVYDEMVRTNTVTRLQALGDVIRQNRHYVAAKGLEKWQGQFEDWAAMLEAKKDPQGGSGAACAGQSIDPETFLALARARRAEEALREQTRLVEKSKEQDPRYRYTASALATKQGDVAEDMRDLCARPQSSCLRNFIAAVAGLMDEAGCSLHKPDTGPDTVAIETEIIEALSGLMSQCQSQSSACAALAQALGLAASPTGGGSMAGGDPAGQNTRVAGPGAGGGSEARPVPRAAGVDSARWPEEYRSALQSYFQGLEETP